MSHREKLWNQFYAKHFLEFLNSSNPVLSQCLGVTLNEKSWKRLKQFFLRAPLILVEEFTKAVSDTH